jgi:hypothetical protein
MEMSFNNNEMKKQLEIIHRGGKTLPITRSKHLKSGNKAGNKIYNVDP